MKKIIIFLTIFFICPLYGEWFDRFFQRKNSFIILIDAGGDANQGGHIIDNNFESSINFTIAQSIKNYLSATNYNTKILLNRTPSEIIAPLQNAQFANKLGIDLYIHICSIKAAHKSSITLYQFSYHEKSIIKKGCLGFYPYDQLYLIHELQTTEWAQTIKKNLLEQNQVPIFGVYKMPFKPLMGINAPAIAIEIGITSLNDVNALIAQLNQALQQFCQKM